MCLEASGCVDWSFQFWDFGHECGIKAQMERVNLVESDAYVVERSEIGNESNKRLFQEAFGDTARSPLQCDVGEADIILVVLLLFRLCTVLCRGLTSS